MNNWHEYHLVTANEYVQQHLTDGISLEDLYAIYDRAIVDNPYKTAYMREDFLKGVHRLLEIQIDIRYPNNGDESNYIHG